MQMLVTVFGLLGAGLVGLWLAFSGQQRDQAQRRVQQPPRHRAVPPVSYPTTGEPSIYADIARHWTSETPAAWSQPRISRRGFGTNLASQPVRRRTWSQFAYPGMWSELHR